MVAVDGTYPTSLLQTVQQLRSDTSASRTELHHRSFPLRSDITRSTYFIVFIQVRTRPLSYRARLQIGLLALVRFSSEVLRFVRLSVAGHCKFRDGDHQLTDQCD